MQQVRTRAARQPQVALFCIVVTILARMSEVQVRDIMKNVDGDGNGIVSKKEYLVKIRTDRKYADFLKMPPRIRQSDGTLDRFFDIFHAINISRTGTITTNELAYYLGCNPQSDLLSERSVTPSVGGALVGNSRA